MGEIMLEISSSFTQPSLNLGQPARLEAPIEHVNQFTSLLGGLKSALVGGSVTLAERKEKQPKIEGGLLEEASLTVAKAEVSIGALETEIKKGIHHIPNGENLMNNSVIEISYQKIVSDFANTSYIVMGNKAADINEEMTSLTKSR